MVITITKSGYIKSLPLATYRQQRRGGVGVTGMGMKDDDYIEHLFVCSTHDYLLFFTNRGKVYRSKVYDLPEAPSRTVQGPRPRQRAAAARGRARAVRARHARLQRVRSTCSSRPGAATVKKTELQAYNTPIKADGIIAIKIRDDDELVAVRRVDEGDEILMVSQAGLAVRFPEERRALDGPRHVRRARHGRRGQDNAVIAMDVARDDQDLLVVTENGYGKRTLDRRLPQDEPRREGRQDDPADRGEGRAGRRARRARPPGARLHLAERHGPAHRRARHQPLRPQRAGLPADERARGRPRLRRRARRRVRDAADAVADDGAVSLDASGVADEPALEGDARASSATRTRKLLAIPELESDAMPTRISRTRSGPAAVPDVRARRTRSSASGARTAEGPDRHRGPRRTPAGLLGRRQLSQAAGGTNSGADDGGATVWIPLTSGSSTRLVLAAGHLQGPVRTVTQVGPPPFSGVRRVANARGRPVRRGVSALGGFRQQVLLPGRRDRRRGELDEDVRARHPRLDARVHADLVRSRSPLRRLHGAQEATMFSQSDPPPLERGITWSTVRLVRAPQYWHSQPSRAKTARRVILRLCVSRGMRT